MIEPPLSVYGLNACDTGPAAVLCMAPAVAPKCLESERVTTILLVTEVGR